MEGFVEWYKEQKKIRFAVGVVIGCLLGWAMLPSNAEAGLWDSMATSNMPEKDVETAYKLETYGHNVRVYEWTPKDNKNVRCVFVAGNENSTGVACYPVEKSKEK